MIKQGAVRVDDQKVEDRALQLQGGHSYVVQVGKRRVARVVID
jgi:tyrosyl-tRNA synthetase